MILQQIFDLVNKRTYFSRAEEEIWAAIDDAANDLYQQILAENSGFFLKWDTTTIALVAGTEEYACPGDLRQMVRMRERPNGTTDWFVVDPSDLNSQQFIDMQFGSVISTAMDGPMSDFMYYGPYLLAADAQTVAQIEHVRFSPIPQDSRQVELVYTAKYVPVTDKDSPLVIEPDGHWALLYEASGQLQNANKEGAGEEDLAQARARRTIYLKTVRARQTQKVRQVTPFIEDMD